MALSTIDSTITFVTRHYTNVLDSKGEILIMQDSDNIDEAEKLRKQVEIQIPNYCDYFKDSKLYSKLKEKGRAK